MSQVSHCPPYPLELRKAMDAAMDDIIQLMTDDLEVPMYRGKPV